MIRRKNRKGYKAGNLNHFLQHMTEGYFVIIDSDEILPVNFVTRALDYFTEGVGIVPGESCSNQEPDHIHGHLCARSRCPLACVSDCEGSRGVLVSAWPRSDGLPRLLAGCRGFPEIVAEDIGFAIDAREHGYRTVFAPDILCEEEFPVDYAAFRKRHRKWTEGNMEFIRMYTRKILFTHSLKWWEKLDIILFTYGLPLTGIFSLYVIVNAILFPMLHFSMRFPLWMLAPTVIFLVAPMINDVITWRKAPKPALVSYLAIRVLLFGSVYFTSLSASLRPCSEVPGFTSPRKTLVLRDFGMRCVQTGQNWQQRLSSRPSCRSLPGASSGRPADYPSGLHDLPVSDERRGGRTSRKSSHSRKGQLKMYSNTYPTALAAWGTISIVSGWAVTDGACLGCQ